MGVIYDSSMFIKIPNKMKEDAEKKAEKMGKKLSSYIRDLIVNDLKQK